jgi:hypothetical protein
MHMGGRDQPGIYEGIRTFDYELGAAEAEEIGASG